MPSTSKSKKVSVEELEQRAMRGEDITSHFSDVKTQKGFKNPRRVDKSIQRVNVDFSQDMLKELDSAAELLNISRQAVIKTLVREALDRHYLAKKARKTS